MDTTESELPVPSSMSNPTSDSAHVGRHHFIYGSQQSHGVRYGALAVESCGAGPKGGPLVVQGGEPALPFREGGEALLSTYF
jgi:hypothetical protein